MDSMEAIERTTVVRMRGISKRFPGVLALSGVDLDLVAGEAHALVGENGSGKSTLCKCLYGAHQPDGGTIEIDGVPCTINSSHRALQLGIAAISQELTLAPSLSATENILMGRLPVGPLGIDWQKANAIAREALDYVGVDIDEREIVSNLSVELQQEVEIARAISVNSRVLILDEATSSLSEAATERLMEIIEQLRAKGVAIVYVSHRLKEIFACCQVATVLRDGMYVDTVRVKDTTQEELVSKMVGREIKDLYGKRHIAQGEPVLRVRNLSTPTQLVKNVSFELHAGEILGLAGLVGSGKVRLGEALFGAIPASGEVTLDGKPVRLGDPRNGIAAGLGFVPDDRKLSALLLPRSVRHNLSLPWVNTKRFLRLGYLNKRAETRAVEDAMDRFNIRANSAEMRVEQLSGGNQQKVVLARWLALKPRVLILAEPTRGIDVGAKSEIYGFMQDLAKAGSGILMISSEMPELLGVADRILVMFQGEICGEFDPETATEEDIARAACIAPSTTVGTEP